MSTPTYLVHSDEYAYWIFDPSHPTQGRRFINARNLFVELEQGGTAGDVVGWLLKVMQS